MILRPYTACGRFAMAEDGRTWRRKSDGTWGRVRWSRYLSLQPHEQSELEAARRARDLHVALAGGLR